MLKKPLLYLCQRLPIPPLCHTGLLQDFNRYRKLFTFIISARLSELSVFDKIDGYEYAYQAPAEPFLVAKPFYPSLPKTSGRLFICPNVWGCLRITETGFSPAARKGVPIQSAYFIQGFILSPLFTNNRDFVFFR